jgi:hypothetical protein
VKNRIEALNGEIFNLNENNENHRMYPSACVNIGRVYEPKLRLSEEKK